MACADLSLSMRCHYCDEPAVVAPAHDGIRVGLCRFHVRTWFERIGDDGALRELERRIDG
ncbi:MAG: DUF6757 family protein [Halobacteriota archaeon]